mgnify:CR=1 FL=1
MNNRANNVKIKFQCLNDKCYGNPMEAEELEIWFHHGDAVFEFKCSKCGRVSVYDTDQDYSYLKEEEEPEQ